MSDRPIDNRPEWARAVDFLRRHTSAVLRAGGEFRNVRFVVGSAGSPIIFGPRSLHEEPSLVLFIPSDQEGALELMVNAVEKDGQSADADRWRIYHGRPEDALCLVLEIEAGKFRGVVLDGDELTRPNPCDSFEPAVCRWMNSERRSDLKALCRHFNNIAVDEALLVGVDPAGFDIRAKAGIIRVEALRPIAGEGDARAMLERMCREARGVRP